MKIKELRIKAGISQRELAQKLGYFPQAISRYESGQGEPNVETLIKLANFFNVSIDELVGRETDTINLKYLNESESYLIKKILKMNSLELAKTKAYVTGLMED